MQLLVLLLTALTAAAAPACTSCPHPGTFTGNVGLYPDPNPNSCDIVVGDSDIAASIPSSFFDPPDESPCGQLIDVTLISSGKTVTAIVVNSDSTLTPDDINLTTNGLAALAADGDPNHGTGPVYWTFE
ncbi:hypothetical protein BOTBODRAFT_30624 [Botryobasidium botryosum FD-172 SS1]|uniref:RlpA-like protein double-psi beta-barrel domain-containing protein n=1 Tax=Botryobasidium botryosum (strain FD-172 SS1) TaxID=930990 RepID=A0A067MXT8_BOTB1|nr:hypothetical protein BOTBODRAFT_30624 [Botryobasidium botryosum FD-172 SS1]